MLSVQASNLRSMASGMFFAVNRERVQHFLAGIAKTLFGLTHSTPTCKPLRY